ncbi:hypothetical protein [Maricaulis sp.]|uniref:hypothetical protein n=1 Tax=Maricaulis sp. TaxID=1486257 RepID=UPI002625D4C6|nr:hypothetical protein [Maricaulis sp.]
MSSIRDAFDGSKVQEGLADACSFTPDHTHISLVARGVDGFVVINGSDMNRDPFDDAQISQIFMIFAETVDEYRAVDAATLRLAVGAALAGMWTPCGAVDPCPFDQHVRGATRMIFNMHVPGWGFEEARIKFKSDNAGEIFCGLSWLTLNGESRQPYSFQINAAAATAPAEYEFALFVQASQDAGNQVTRLIIDPKIHVIPPM